MFGRPCCTPWTTRSVGLHLLTTPLRSLRPEQYTRKIAVNIYHYQRQQTDSMSEPANQQHTQNSANTAEVQEPPNLRTGAAVGTATGAALGAAAAGGLSVHAQTTRPPGPTPMKAYSQLAAHSFGAAAARQPFGAGMQPPPQLACINLPLLPCSHTDTSGGASSDPHPATATPNPSPQPLPTAHHRPGVRGHCCSRWRCCWRPDWQRCGCRHRL